MGAPGQRPGQAKQRRSGGRGRSSAGAPPASSPAHLADPSEESLLRQPGRAIHSLAVVLRAPAGTVDVDVVGVEAQGMGLHSISHLPIQHAHA